MPWYNILRIAYARHKARIHNHGHVVDVLNPPLLILPCRLCRKEPMMDANRVYCQKCYEKSLLRSHPDNPGWYVGRVIELDRRDSL